jgi:hypothetical protein
VCTSTEWQAGKDKENRAGIKDENRAEDKDKSRTENREENRVEDRDGSWTKNWASGNRANDRNRSRADAT